MLVYVLALGRVVLYHPLLRSKEHILDGAHLFPGLARLSPTVSRRHADVLPASVVGSDHEK